MLTLGIIGAMDEEIELLINELNTTNAKKIVDFKFYESKYDNIKLIITKSGIGKVNSAVNTQILISEYKPDYIINTGIAGGISDKVKFADIVLASETMEHDVDVRDFGYKLGQIPRMKEYIFKTDDYLLNIAIKSIEKNYRYKVGRIISGDIFVNDNKTKKYLKENFKALCVDMESGSIGHVCYLNNVPYLAVRTISDNSDGDSNPSNDKIAAKISCELILKILNKL